MKNRTEIEELLGSVNVSSSLPLPEDVVFAVIVAAYAVSLATNLLVVVVILRSKKLRKSFGHAFIVCLCVFDLLASGALGSKCIFRMTIDNVQWMNSDSIMNIDGFFNAFFALTTIYSIVAITFEKFYCIKYPMHHSTHMNKMLVCVSVCGIVTLAAVVASVPLGWNGYSQNKTECRCMSLWGDNIRPLFVLFVGVVVFIIPIITMMFVNCEVYKIAKKAMMQVNPFFESPHRRGTLRRISVINMEESSGQQCSLDSERDFSVVKIGNCVCNYDVINDVTYDTNSVFGPPAGRRPDLTLNKGQVVFDNDCKSNNNIISHSGNTFGNMLGSNLDTSSRRSEPANFKALKSLLLPFSYFTLVWGSYFLLYIHWMIVPDPHQQQLFETICMLIVHLSYALNPFVFGVKSGIFREELIKQVKICFGKKIEAEIDLQDAIRSNENFLQFLERTSQPHVLTGTR